MKNECNIVKDLLPLYLDGAVSEDSRKFVEEHTAICEDCAKDRREMMLALPKDQEPQVEQTVLKKAAKKLRRKHMRRGAVLTVASVLLGILLIFGGNWLHWYLWENWNVPMPLDEYEIRLSTLERGQLVLSYIWQSDSSAFSCRIYDEDAEDNGCIVTFEPHTTRLRHPSTNKQARGDASNFLWRDGKIWTPDGRQVVAMAKQGPHGEREVFYQYGVDESLIAPASELMEEYYRLENESQVYAVLVAGRRAGLADYIDPEKLPFKPLDDTEALLEQMRAIDWRMEELRTLVPEWQ